MSINVLYRPHTDFFLKEGYYLALQFKEGWAVFRILGREPTNVKPFQLVNTLATASALAAWTEVQDAAARRYLEPINKDTIYHCFWGVQPSPIRVYYQYPVRRDRWSLVEVTRALGGIVGYIAGYDSPYDGPLNERTEIFTVEDLYPAFNAFNPVSYQLNNIVMQFDIMRYSYHVITDKDLIKSCLTGKTPCKSYTMGGVVDPTPAEIPDWLGRKVKKSLLDYSIECAEGN